MRRWILIASLCLNVMFIAAIVTVGWRIAHRDPRLGAGGPVSPRALMAAYPDAQGRIQAIVDAHGMKIDSLRHASIAAREAAVEALAAPDASPARLTQSLDAVTRADAAWESEAVAMMGESLAALTPAERQALGARLKRRERSWWYRTFVKRS